MDRSRFDLLLPEKISEEVSNTVDCWWLDDLVDRIEFGRHSYAPTELAAMPEEMREAADDSTMTIRWKCGVVQTVPTGIIRDSQFPKHKAIQMGWETVSEERLGEIERVMVSDDGVEIVRMAKAS